MRHYFLFWYRRFYENVCSIESLTSCGLFERFVHLFRWIFGKFWCLQGNWMILFTATFRNFLTQPFLKGWNYRRCLHGSFWSTSPERGSGCLFQHFQFLMLQWYLSWTYSMLEKLHLLPLNFWILFIVSLSVIGPRRFSNYGSDSTGTTKNSLEKSLLLTLNVPVDLFVQVWLAEKCQDSVCLGTRSTPHHGWNPPVNPWRSIAQVLAKSSLKASEVITSKNEVKQN